MTVGSLRKERDRIGQVHESNGFGCQRFFQERVDRFLMQTGLEKILKFRKGLIQIGSKLDFQPGSLFDRFLTETPQFFEVHQIQIFKGNEPIGFLYHKSLADDVSANLICLRFADAIFPHGRSRKRIEDTDIVALRNKVAAIHSCRVVKATGKNQKSTVSELY